MVAIGLLAIIFSISTASAASDVYVGNNGNDSDGFGTLDNPYKTIEYGIQKVDVNGNVNLAAGTYTGTGNRNITISKNVAIVGAGMNNTIIDAEGASKVFTIDPLVSVIIKDLTIQNAKNSFPLNGTGETMDDLGGAINNKYGSLLVENVKFVNNQGHKGSGIANTGDLTVRNSIFINNHDNEWGGAIMNMGSLVVTNSIFTSNIGDTEGGAIFNHNEATITGSTFENNVAGNLVVGAPGKGGAIFSVNMLFNSILTANNNRFINNKMLESDPSFFLPGSSGPQFNDIYVDSQYDFASTSDVSKNWWGQSTGPKAGQYFKFSNNGTITYEPWLTSDPNNPDTTPPTVTATPKGGTYSSAQNVVLTANEAASIYYTTDGSTPTKSSTLYSGPISISSSKTLKFTAWDTAGNQGSVYTEVYTISSAAKPDLRVDSVTTGGNTVTGAGYVVSGSVKNYGGSVTKMFYVSFYLSTDTTKSDNDRYIGATTVNGLGGGSSVDAQLTATIPRNVAQGNYYIIAVVDVNRLVAESNEANNAKASGKIFVWRPDLRVKSVTTGGSTVTGAGYVVSSLVENNGGATGDKFFVSYYLSTDATKSSNDRYIGAVTVNGLGGWSTTTAQLTATIPKDVPQGSYYVIAVVDVNGLIPESYESNNAKASSGKIFVWRPDLRVKSVTTGGNTARGATNYSVSSTVENNGGATGDKFFVSYYLSTDTTKSSNDRYIGAATVNGLGGWSTTTATAKCSIPSNIARGWYYLITVADVPGTVPESYESNNVKASATRIYVS